MMLKLFYGTSLLMLLTGFSFAQKSALNFSDQQQKFDKVQEGEMVEFVYEFTNISDSPVIINEYQVSCKCTSVAYPKTPITPNGKGEIKVSFDTKGKIGFQKRTILLKTTAGNYELIFKGVVKASEATKEAYKKGS